MTAALVFPASARPGTMQQLSRLLRRRGVWLSVPISFFLLPAWSWIPLLALAGIAWVWQSLHLRAQRKRANWDEVSRLARLLSIGLAGGLSLPVALEESRPLLGKVVGQEVESILRLASRRGLGAGLAIGAGPHTSDLFLRLATAHSSGAPMLRGVEAFLERRRIEDRAQLMTRARTLPTRLIIPVALLILPGLLLLILGPVIVERIGSMLTPLLSG